MGSSARERRDGAASDLDVDRYVGKFGEALNKLPIEVKARLRRALQPDWIAPMLATLTQERFSREGWLFEPKWDGERCLAFRQAVG